MPSPARNALATNTEVRRIGPPWHLHLARHDHACQQSVGQTGVTQNLSTLPTRASQRQAQSIRSDDLAAQLVLVLQIELIGFTARAPWTSSAGKLLCHSIERDNISGCA